MPFGWGDKEATCRFFAPRKTLCRPQKKLWILKHDCVYTLFDAEVVRDTRYTFQTTFVGMVISRHGKMAISVQCSARSLSYVTASNSRYNPVELFAILIFGSDLGARFDSKLQHSAFWVRTQHCSGRILSPKSVRNRKSNRVQSWSSWFRCRSTLPTRPGLHSVGLAGRLHGGLASKKATRRLGHCLATIATSVARPVLVTAQRRPPGWRGASLLALCPRRLLRKDGLGHVLFPLRRQHPPALANKLSIRPPFARWG